MKNKDVFFGIGVILLSCLFYSQVLTLPKGPAEFPRALLVLMLISGVGIVVRAIWRQRKGKDEEREEESVSLKEFVFNALIPSSILIVLCILMMFIGFYIGCFLLFILIFILQDVIIKGKFALKKKDVVKLLVSTLGVTVFLYLCFSVLLKLPVPMGPWGF